ncbi:TetR/AcrR family transcriptional regulator [Photobacterium ganghwense]|uniref:LuxR family transcriptional regulator n=1 Tax=Photobacterium ganghwense TaxID=320778 RepID=A0A0J1H3K3_9GAMM|nr:TetR/AcrR family transcriptional regulator [Photobacterium ganghwense]KLV06319.1 LuxR family transcriptional regulator [Photobacterium ganghwense]PSU06684.1 TetR/AcrR family transcriptional regulator [Photobacterium ganghwense]QSV14471.1 TetR/AcrR family transcriptional regulator [Photobacterium ganghwense]
MDTILKKTRTRLSPEKRKEQLLNFAMDVFARRGIGRAGHADIAEMANVSVATVFNYFPTREALVEEVLGQVEQCFKSMLAESFDNDQPFQAQLTQISHRLIDEVIEQQDWVKVWFEWSTSVRDEIWPQFVSNNQQNFAFISEQFEAAKIDGVLSGQERAWQFQGLCYVLYLQTNINPDRDAMQEKATLHIQALLEK